jgi:hypothetical protein
MRWLNILDSFGLRENLRGVSLPCGMFYARNNHDRMLMRANLNAFSQDMIAVSFAVVLN